LVYLNMNDYGVRQAETEAAIATTKSEFADAFSPIWIIWKDKSNCQLPKASLCAVSLL
jgi:hypothetical protein